MDLDFLEPVAEFLAEAAPGFLVSVFGEREAIPPSVVSSKTRVQTVFGSDGWWNG